MYAWCFPHLTADSEQRAPCARVSGVGVGRSGLPACCQRAVPAARQIEGFAIQVCAFCSTERIQYDQSSKPLGGLFAHQCSRWHVRTRRLGRAISLAHPAAESHAIDTAHSHAQSHLHACAYTLTRQLARTNGPARSRSHPARARKLASTLNHACTPSVRLATDG